MRVAELGLESWALLFAAPVIGSFLGVIIQRLPERRPIVWARSACEACGATLAPRDLIPLLSWIASRARCRHCGARLSSFYPAVEIAALAVAALALMVDGVRQAWLDCLLGWWLLTLAWIDLRCWRLPDVLTLPLIVAGLLAAAIFAPHALFDRALAAAFGYAALRLVASAYRVFRGREGLGGGDAKLLAAAGAWVGVAALPQLIFAAAIAALVAALALHLGGRQLGAQSALPFGPFIALAAWLLWLFGPLPV